MHFENDWCIIYIHSGIASKWKKEGGKPRGVVDAASLYNSDSLAWQLWPTDSRKTSFEN